MDNFDTISGTAQMLADFFGHHDGAMLSAGTSEGDGQITLAFVNVVRKKDDEEVGNSGNELARLRKRADVARNFRIAARQWAEFGNEVGVGEKTNVENQIGILGHPLTEAETDTGDKDALVGRFFLLKALVDVRAQFMNVEFRGIDDEVGQVANGTEMTALLL